MKPLSVPSYPQFVWYKTVRRYRSRKLRTVLFRWYYENSSLVALDMMTKTRNFVTKKIADGVNKFLNLFCLILIWCVCMVFSKISLVTAHGANINSIWLSFIISMINYGYSWLIKGFKNIILSIIDILSSNLVVLMTEGPVHKRFSVTCGM